MNTHELVRRIGTAMKIKKYFLIFAFLVVSTIALLYGISPPWFVQTFLNIPVVSADLAHILRAVMCLYLALGGFWLIAAFREKYRNAAVLTTVLFAGGLAAGRLLSFFAEGQPSLLLMVYFAMEVSLIPIAIWILRLPD